MIFIPSMKKANEKKKKNHKILHTNIFSVTIMYEDGSVVLKSNLKLGKLYRRTTIRKWLKTIK